MHIQPHNCQHLIADIQLLLDGELDRHKENRVRGKDAADAGQGVHVAFFGRS